MGLNASRQDYDCFYASVFEHERPELKSLPLGVQQKQIIVTCNYEARRKGLHKLQLVSDAKKVCPDVVIVLGEDLTRFRNASKELYAFLSSRVWTGRAERLGFDEVFLDVTDMIDYNLEILNHNDLSRAFFHLDRNDPTVGFPYDATVTSGKSFPTTTSSSGSPSTLHPASSWRECPDNLRLRLRLGSHLAQHLRQQLDEEHGYTATVGISTNKLLSKLVGNLHKPRDQTTLMPPYDSTTSQADHEGNVHMFLDPHEIGKIPGLGYKISQKIREHILGRKALVDSGLIYGSTRENVTVGDVRGFPNMCSELLEKILGGSGSPKGIGAKVWGLINGVDETEVEKARNIPRQISIEDSYIRLDTMEEVKRELLMLATSLLRRMHLDITVMSNDKSHRLPQDEELTSSANAKAHRQWLAHPRTLRLSTRPRPPRNPDGSFHRSFNRISHSGPFPNFVFDMKGDLADSANRLVSESLIPLFRKLHPEKSGWNLSLMNVAVTNIVPAAAGGKEGSGRDIGKMFKMQDDVLKSFKVEDGGIWPLGQTMGTFDRQHHHPPLNAQHIYNPNQIEVPHGSEEDVIPTQASSNRDDTWNSDCGEPSLGGRCKTCGIIMPHFAAAAHERFHAYSD